MVLIFKDRVKQLSTTNGTVNVVMTSTIGGFQTFANALADADTTYYCIVDDTNDDFEVGLGTWAEGSATLTRTTILESSNSNNAVDFSGSVAKEVFITYPAEKAVFLNANNKLVIGGVEYLSATTNRWHKTVPGGATMATASGNDDLGNALTFSGDQVDVFLNGIRLSKDAGDYSLTDSTNTVTFNINARPSSGDILDIISYNIFSGGSSSYADSDVNAHLNQSSASSGQVLSWNGSDYAWISSGSGSLSNIVEDTTPQLGGNLDINGNDIVSTSNANIEILPNGSGKVHLDGDGSTGGVVLSDGLVEIKTGTGNVAELKFYCETNNAHYVSLKAPAHSNFSGNVVLTLPTNDGSSGEYLKTDGSGVLSWDTPSGGGGGGNTDILTIATTSSIPTSVAQDTVKLYENASALYMRSYRGNTAHPVFGIINSTGTQVCTFFANGDLTLTDKITAKKILCEGGSETGRIELQAPNVSDHISINAPATLSGSTDYILPEDGSSGEFLQTNGSGTLSWSTGGGDGYELMQSITLNNTSSAVINTVKDYLYIIDMCILATTADSPLNVAFAPASGSYSGAGGLACNTIMFPASSSTLSNSHVSGNEVNFSYYDVDSSDTYMHPFIGRYYFHQSTGITSTNRRPTLWGQHRNNNDKELFQSSVLAYTNNEIKYVKFNLNSGNMDGTVKVSRRALSG